MDEYAHVCLRWKRGTEHLRLTADRRGRQTLLIPPGVTGEEARDFLRGWHARGSASPCGAALQALCERQGAVLFTGAGKWGVCCTASGEIGLNTALSGFPLECARTILAHERCHLREAAHDPAFFSLLRQEKPDWAYWEGVLRGGWQLRKGKRAWTTTVTPSK